MSGEITLEAGQSYTTPWLYGAYSHQGYLRSASSSMVLCARIFE